MLERVLIGAYFVMMKIDKMLEGIGSLLFD